MKLLYITHIIIAALLINSGSSLAQDNSRTTMEVTAKLMHGLAMEGANNLFLGELALKSQDNKKTISNFDGLKFTIMGQSNRLVTVTYDQFVTLISSIEEGNTQSGAQMLDNDVKIITFRTNIAEETGSHNSYSNPIPMPSGTSVPLYDNSKAGQLNLWVGGTMYLPLSLNKGVYIGKFVVTSVY